MVGVVARGPRSLLARRASSVVARRSAVDRERPRLAVALTITAPAACRAPARPQHQRSRAGDRVVGVLRATTCVASRAMLGEQRARHSSNSAGHRAARAAPGCRAPAARRRSRSRSRLGPRGRRRPPTSPRAGRARPATTARSVQRDHLGRARRRARGPAPRASLDQREPLARRCAGAPQWRRTRSGRRPAAAPGRRAAAPSPAPRRPAPALLERRRRSRARWPGSSMHRQRSAPSPGGSAVEAAAQRARRPPRAPRRAAPTATARPAWSTIAASATSSASPIASATSIACSTVGGQLGPHRRPAVGVDQLHQHVVPLARPGRRVVVLRGERGAEQVGGLLVGVRAAAPTSAAATAARQASAGVRRPGRQPVPGHLGLAARACPPSAVGDPGVQRGPGATALSAA